MIFFLLCRQWLPPEKIEPLGLSSEGDNAKMALAGSSKRSVKEAYCRAKQWLRRRVRHSSRLTDTIDVMAEMSGPDIDDPKASINDLHTDSNTSSDA